MCIRDRSLSRSEDSLGGVGKVPTPKISKIKFYPPTGKVLSIPYLMVSLSSCLGRDQVVARPTGRPAGQPADQPTSTKTTSFQDNYLEAPLIAVVGGKKRPADLPARSFGLGEFGIWGKFYFWEFEIWEFGEFRKFVNLRFRTFEISKFGNLETCFSFSEILQF